MLNVFYSYSIIWGVVFGLYALDLSKYCTTLSPITTIFFLASIGISLVLGTVFRKSFVYHELEHPVDRGHGLTVIIVILGLFELIYSRDIPLLSITRGSSSYSDFLGVPILHTILVNLIIFYSAYLFYLFVETREKGLFIETILMISIFLLMFQKSALIFCLFNFLNLSIAKLRNKYGRLKSKYVMLIILAVFLILYLNGGLTNIRSGVSWNDTSLARGVGGINSKWPKWLPIQLSWAYTYIITPLENLNYNILTNHYQHNIPSLILTAFPDLIVKRAFPSLNIDNSMFRLYTPLLNACTGFIESAVAYGAGGLWYYYIAFTLLMVVFVRKIKSSNQQYRSVFFSVLGMMTVILFFYNTLKTSTTALLPYYIILFIVFSKRKLVFVYKGKSLSW